MAPGNHVLPSNLTITPVRTTVFALIAAALFSSLLVAQTSDTSSDLANDRVRMPANLPPAAWCVWTDLDQDGDQDLLRGAASGLVQWMLQDGAGRLVPGGSTPVANVALGGPVVSITAGLFTADKYPDLIVGQKNGYFRMVSNSGKGLPSRVLVMPALTGVLRPDVSQILTGNVDNKNGDDLVVVLNQSAPQIYLSDGRGGFGKPIALAPSPRLSKAFGLLADLDQDKLLDLLVVSADVRSPGVPLLWQNKGAGRFTLVNAFPNTKLAASCGVVADFTNNRVPDIVLAPTTAASTAVPPFVFVRAAKALSYTAIKNTGTLKTRQPRRLQAADLNKDGYLDLVGLSDTGGLAFGQNLGSKAPGSFSTIADPVAGGGYACLELADLEGDGDVDLHLAGHSVEDSLLLNDGRGRFLDTEAFGMPVGTAPIQQGALLDLVGTPDLDVVLYDGTGTSRLLENVSGQARFAVFDQKIAPPTLPQLPKATYLGVQALAMQVANEATDLLVHGLATSTNPLGVRILVRRRNTTAKTWYLTDQTTSRFARQLIFRRVLAADVFGGSGSAGAAGYSDLLVLDTAGNLSVYPNQKGRFAASPVKVATRVGAAARFCVGDINADGSADIVLTQTSGTRIFFGQPRSDSFTEQTALKSGGILCMLAELTGDRFLDLLLSTTSTRLGLQLLSGNGKGGFVDVSANLLPTIATQPGTGQISLAKSSSLSVLRGGALKPGLPSSKDLALVAAISGARDMVLTKNAKGAFVASSLPFRGSLDSVCSLAEDLDKDGDADLLTIREGSWPSVLIGQQQQFTQMGVTQLGRDLRLKFHRPNSKTQGVLGLGSGILSVDTQPFGVLRVLNPAPILYVGPVQATRHQLPTPTPKSGNIGSVPIQWFLLDYGANTLRFGNLEVLEFVRY